MIDDNDGGDYYSYGGDHNTNGGYYDDNISDDKSI